MTVSGTGKLIVLEGPDGVGKTTQVEFLRQNLASMGIPVIKSREPGNAFDGKLRQLIMSGEAESLAAFFLFITDRAQHVAKTVLPALQAGTWVILDRFSDSTLAYQWWADIDEPTAVHSTFKTWEHFFEFVEASAVVEPDLVVHLALSMVEAKNRLEARSEEMNHFDTASFQRRKRIHEFFSVKMPQLRSKRLVTVDGGQTPEAVARDVISRVNSFFKLRGIAA